MRRYQFTAHINCYIFSHKLPVVTEAVQEEPSETAAKVLLLLLLLLLLLKPLFKQGNPFSAQRHCYQ